MNNYFISYEYMQVISRHSLRVLTAEKDKKIKEEEEKLSSEPEAEAENKN